MSRCGVGKFIDAFAGFWETFGEMPHELVELARKMMGSGNVDGATLLLGHAAKLHPDNIDVVLLSAEAASTSQQWSIAAELYARARELSPKHPAANIYGGWVLWEAGRHAEADVVLEQALTLFPRDPWAAIHYARSAQSRKDWGEAARRYSMVRRDFPDNIAGFVEGGWALWEAGRYPEADAVLERALTLFPSDPWAAFHYAMSAQSRRDWSEAARRYAIVRQNFPHMAAGFIEGGWILREAGRTEEADRVLTDAVERFPGERLAWLHYGRNAAALTNWKEALRRREIAQQRFPDDPELKRELAQARYELQFANVADDNILANKPCTDPRDVAEGATEIMMRFSSIGDNCEFGLVQRHFGAEPLGLLRFVKVPSLDFLLEALKDQFRGVGEQENTSSQIIGDEVVISSAKGFSLMHSHVYLSSGATQEGTVAQMLPRLKYLRRRMLDELRAGEKIFVYKRFAPLSDSEIRSLHEALEIYGSNTLFCVLRPTSYFGEGEVRRLDERIAIGYVDFPELAGLVDARFDVWMEVCRKAAKLLASCGLDQGDQIFAAG